MLPGLLPERWLVSARSVAVAGGAASAGGPIQALPLDRCAVARQLGSEPSLESAARLLLGGEVTCFGVTVIVKPPHDPSLVAWWHQDGYPWARHLGVTEAVTAWAPLERAGRAEGGLAVIPGSHHLEAQPLGGAGCAPEDDAGVGGGGGGDGGLFGGGIDRSLVESERAVYLDLHPGDVSFHHPRLVHGSPANTGARPRRAVVLRYRRS